MKETNETVSPDDIAKQLTARQKAALVKFARCGAAHSPFGTDARGARMTRAEMAELVTSRFQLVQWLSEAKGPKFFRLTPMGRETAAYLVDQKDVVENAIEVAKHATEPNE